MMDAISCMLQSLPSFGSLGGAGYSPFYTIHHCLFVTSVFFGKAYLFAVVLTLIGSVSLCGPLD